MRLHSILANDKKFELDDEMLENVAGGTSTTYRCGRCDYAYNADEHEKCPNCGANNIGQLLKPPTFDR